MPQKLEDRILDLATSTPLPIPRGKLSQLTLKQTADVVCKKLELAKCSHSEVASKLLNLFEENKLMVAYGRVTVVTPEDRLIQGRRATGLRKGHARGRTKRMEWVAAV